MAAALAPRTALDLFCGTTRVAQALKATGAEVTAVDSARYAATLARCYIATDATTVDHAALADAVAELNALPGRPGYVTETFCEQSRFFMPHNGARIDAIRTAIADDHAGTPLEPLLLTSLLEAADRVDSTTGVQMAYLKSWAPRARNDLELRVPHLLAGHGHAHHGDATALVDTLPPVDLAYLDPPYNQHRYLGNYHIWETLVAWDAPEHYGVACKRTDLRDDATRSPFNAKRQMPAALASVIARCRAEVLIVSYNDESWVTADELVAMCAARHVDDRPAHVEVLAFDSKRYVGAQIGIHDPAGNKVGAVSHLRNQEYLVVSGPPDAVAAATAAGRAAHPTGRRDGMPAATR